MASLLLAFLLAVPPDHLGTIVFPNSGKPEAQAAFLRGVLLLHNFAYPQAKEAFVEAQKIDPKFALAYWGEAMTYNHPLWNQIDVEAGRRALKNAGSLTMTPRERGYVEAVEALYSRDKYAYEAAMERLAKANPTDVEAQVFWALSILGSREWHQLDERRSVRAAAILEELFPTHQDHPGVLHYLIHAYDDPVHAPLGLRAARLYAKVASSAPHALHMPSHIFLQLGMWDDTARSNEAAYALSKEWKQPDMHSLHWLQYAYLQQHRFADAKRLIEDGHGEDMKVRYAAESGDWEAFEFHEPLGKALQAIHRKKFDDAESFIKELKPEGPEPDEVRALLAGARGNWNEAFRYARQAIVAEEKLGVPSGPPENFKPAHELYGELLMQAGKKAEAVAQFETSLLRTPNRTASVMDLKAASSGSVPGAPR